LFFKLFIVFTFEKKFKIVNKIPCIYKLCARQTKLSIKLLINCNLNQV